MLHFDALSDLRHRNPPCARPANGVRADILDNWSDIVARAIDYTDRILLAAPSYRSAAISGLTRLKDALARRSPGHPALERLDAYLRSLIDGSGPGS